MFKVGDKVGDLTVLRATDRRYKGGILWECSCVCGCPQERTTNQLNNSLKYGRAPKCPRCLSLYRKRKIAYLRLWQCHGTLYPTWWSEMTRAELMDELIEDIAPLRALSVREINEMPPTPISALDDVWDGTAGDIDLENDWE